MKRTKILILLSVLLFPNVTFAQEKNELEDSSHTQISLPRFDVHIAAGWISGARIGLRTLISEHFSFEISAGIPLTHFFGGGEREERYAIGINWHPFYISGIIISITCVTLVQPNVKYPNIPNNRLLNYLTGSFSVGYLSNTTRDITFFIRGGIGFIEFVEDQPDKKYSIRYNSIPNFDLGLGFNFSFN